LFVEVLVRDEVRF